MFKLELQTDNAVFARRQDHGRVCPQGYRTISRTAKQGRNR
jgi:hypothetical protein